MVIIRGGRHGGDRAAGPPAGRDRRPGSAARRRHRGSARRGAHGDHAHAERGVRLLSLAQSARVDPGVLSGRLPTGSRQRGSMLAFVARTRVSRGARLPSRQASLPAIVLVPWAARSLILLSHCASAEPRRSCPPHNALVPPALRSGSVVNLAAQASAIVSMYARGCDRADPGAAHCVDASSIAVGFRALGVRAPVINQCQLPQICSPTSTRTRTARSRWTSISTQRRSSQSWAWQPSWAQRSWSSLSALPPPPRHTQRRRWRRRPPQRRLGMR